MIEWTITIAAITGIGAWLLGALAKSVMLRQSHRSVRVDLETGEKVRVSVDPSETDTAIKESIERSTRRSLKSSEPV